MLRLIINHRGMAVVWYSSRSQGNNVSEELNDESHTADDNFDFCVPTLIYGLTSSNVSMLIRFLSIIRRLSMESSDCLLIKMHFGRQFSLMMRKWRSSSSEKGVVKEKWKGNHHYYCLPYNDWCLRPQTEESFVSNNLHNGMRCCSFSIQRNKNGI